MKTKVVFIIFVVVATSQQTKPPYKIHRKYLKEENDPFRTKHIVYEDKSGKLNFENLTVFMGREGGLEATPLDPNVVTLYLYTRRSGNKSVSFKVNDIEGLIRENVYDPTKGNFFVIHGWKSDYQDQISTDTKKAILKIDDFNVFVVDWSPISQKLYVTAFTYIQEIGYYLGNFIKNMIRHYKLSPTMFNIVGHSLGAHIAGCTGATLNGLANYIVGLDPAGPLFSLDNKENRLDSSDAKFVQVVHTSSRFLGLGLGLGSSIGHADFYPNGGVRQPGCPINDLMSSTCSHGRAYLYYQESILRGGFKAMRCANYFMYKIGFCQDTPTSYIGTINIDTKAYGDYYLDTNLEPVYGS